MNRFIAGIDGGASKTSAVIVDETGREIGRGLAGGSNPQVSGFDTALRNLQTAVTEAANRAGIDFPLTMAVIGISGMDRPADHRQWTGALQNLSQPLATEYRLSNDAELILFAHPGQAGIGLISGTGSIAVGRDRQGTKTRAGGWGYLFGDEGSGQWLGREALRLVARMTDGRTPRSLLAELLLAELKLSRPEEIIGAVYTHPVDYGAVAKLAGVVFKAADEGDTNALELVKWAARELAEIALAVRRKLTFTEPPPLALAGGIILNYPLLRRDFEQWLVQSGEIGSLVEVPDAALAAARGLVRDGEEV